MVANKVGLLSATFIQCVIDIFGCGSVAVESSEDFPVVTHVQTIESY